MSIQWFPGHMFKAKKELADKLSDIDAVIEMVDARLPMSSSNPMLAAMIQHKHSLKILNKQDLADPAAVAGEGRGVAGDQQALADAGGGLLRGYGARAPVRRSCRLPWRGAAAPRLSGGGRGFRGVTTESCQKRKNGCSRSRFSY